MTVRSFVLPPSGEAIIPWIEPDGNPVSITMFSPLPYPRRVVLMTVDVPAGTPPMTCTLQVRLPNGSVRDLVRTLNASGSGQGGAELPFVEDELAFVPDEILSFTTDRPLDNPLRLITGDAFSVGEPIPGDLILLENDVVKTPIHPVHAETGGVWPDQSPDGATVYKVGF